MTASGKAAAGARVSLHTLPTAFERGELYARGVTHPDAVIEAPTDPRGFFEIEAPEVGMWTVRVEAPGRAPVEYRIQPLLEDIQLPTVDLKPAAEFIVMTRDDGKPVPARVLVYRMRPGMSFVGGRSVDYRNDAWNLPLCRTHRRAGPAQDLCQRGRDVFRAGDGAWFLAC